ncbi:hypothetical protein MRQ47_004481 [Salmonella enterica]|nr:hypothetical protein [Salmonella enterica]
MKQETQIRNLAALAARKAHLEAVRRLQLALTLELRAAGMGGRADAALRILDEEIENVENAVSTSYDNQLFTLTEAAAERDSAEEPAQ